MINLAGRNDCDKFIAVELEEAAIPIVTLNTQALSTDPEVPWRIYGALGDWTFKRSWYYYVATCPELSRERIPYTAACWIQKDHGKTARLDGDCACRGPAIWLPNRESARSYHVDCLCGLRYLAEVVQKIHWAMSGNERWHETLIRDYKWELPELTPELVSAQKSAPN